MVAKGDPPYSLLRYAELLVIGQAALHVGQCPEGSMKCTGFSSEIGTKLRDWAVGQDGGSCYSLAALSTNDSKTRYFKPEFQTFLEKLHV